MHDAIARSTFAYATVLFVVLFAPQVGLSHHDASGAFVSLFPNLFSFLGMLAVLYVAVRHAMAGHADALFARGFARGAAVSCLGAVLYAIGIGVIGPGIFSDPGFTWIAVALSTAFVIVIGSAASALFAFLHLRGVRSVGRPA